MVSTIFRGTFAHSNLLSIKVSFAIRLFLEELSGTVAKELVVSDLKFEGTSIPCFEKCKIIRVDEGSNLVRVLGVQDILFSAYLISNRGHLVCPTLPREKHS